MSSFARSLTRVALCVAAGCVGYGCAARVGGGGGGGGGLPGPEEETLPFSVDTAEAGSVAVAANERTPQEVPAELPGQAPANTTSGTVSVDPQNVNFGEPGAAREAHIIVHVAPATAQDPCADEFAVLDFTATEDDQGVITLDGTTDAELTGEGDVLDAVAADEFVFCFVITADFTGTVTISAVDITLTGTSAGNGNENESGNENGNENENVSDDFFTCTSPDGQDDDVEFRDPGTTKVIASTLGEGRHMVLSSGWDLIYEFDQPVRFCAVIPEHFTLTNADTGDEIDIPAANLAHRHITDAADVVVRSRVIISLPEGLSAGSDYELVLSATGLSLNGEFQQTDDTETRSNGRLPSGNGAAGGDFVQLFRGLDRTDFLTSTNQAGGLALDAQDNLYIATPGGLYGPFSERAEVTEGKRLASNLSELASQIIAVNNDGDIIVKGMREPQTAYLVDPDTGNAATLAQVSVQSYPYASVIAPEGYGSVEAAGVQAGDMIISGDSGLTVPDFATGSGDKGGLKLVERDSISDAYVSLFVPPTDPGKPRTVYAGYRGDFGFEIHRILPNGIVDRSVFTDQFALASVDGTSVVQLEDMQGREEFLIVGMLTTDLAETKQVFGDDVDFDGRGVMIYNRTEDRLQVVFPMDITLFTFNSFGPFSYTAISSDLDEVYLSLPGASVVKRFSGLANGAEADGNPPCDSSFDQGIDFGQPGLASVFRSTLGNGRYLLESSQTVLMYDITPPLPICSVNADNVTLTEMDTGLGIPLDDGDITRAPLFDEAGQVAGSRLVIDLPADQLAAGTFYELTLSGDGFGLDGEFNGSLPSGDGNPGGDFVQPFRIIEGSVFLSETGNAAGIAIDDSGRLFVSNEDQVFGPFTGPTEVSQANALGQGLPMLSGGGRPLGVGTAGNVVLAGRNNGTVVSIDPAAGVVEQIGRNVGGSFEVNVVLAPDGFTGPNVNPGDLVVCNFGRGTVPDLVSGDGATTFFNDSDVSSAYKNFFAPPAALFGPLFYGSYHVASPLGFTVKQITANGQVSEVFARPLAGVNGKAAIRLHDVEGGTQWLILADFDQLDSPQLPTGQIRGATAGLELLIYDAASDTIQVLGSVSRGEENAPALLSADAEPDFAFTKDLNTVFITQPVARTVVRLDGVGLDQPAE